MLGAYRNIHVLGSLLLAPVSSPHDAANSDSWYRFLYPHPWKLPCFSSYKLEVYSKYLDLSNETKSLKNLDPAYKRDLDFWDSFL